MTFALPMLAVVVAVWCLLLLVLSGDNRVVIPRIVRVAARFAEAAQRLARQMGLVAAAARQASFSMAEAQAAFVRAMRSIEARGGKSPR